MAFSPTPAVSAALAAALLAAVPIAPAAADEFREVVEGALEAYDAGDATAAREDLEYALRLLSEMKAEGLAAFLPPAPPGWTRSEAEASGAGAAMAMLGGGSTAAAEYRRGSEAFTLTLVANSPMVSGVAAMISGMASLAGAQTRRIQRTVFAVQDGEVQGVVGGRVLVSASGDASAADMISVIETMDLRALAAY